MAVALLMTYFSRFVLACSVDVDDGSWYSYWLVIFMLIFLPSSRPGTDDLL